MGHSVVDLYEVEPDIALVKMQDKANKNTFTRELISGLMEAFESIEANLHYKVVILTGYDNYFASGGTKDGLLSIFEGNAKFNDLNIYSLALDCRIPVISAMQGHGIGGGFVLGLYADFVILSRESIYTTNFMRYGFTPGLGSTYILSKKLGFSLAEELLLSGNYFRGQELEKRAIPFPVLPRQEVMNYALQLARSVAEKPRNSLIVLKDHLVNPIREELPKIIEKELAMHEKTFHNPQVKALINSLYGKE
ncbi:polyketide synthase [Syntrophomonas curvata]